MELIRLPTGEQAPIDTDCISLQELPDGGFSMKGSLLAGDESEAIVSPIPCASREDAEEKGVAWAAGCGVATLYVSTTLLAGE